jgi:hypothetical protein
MMAGTLLMGATPWVQPEREVRGQWRHRDGEAWYVISDFDAMDPFFMTVVSDADHWLFIASTGGLTCGRGSAEHALFPYCTEDRLTENAENTGPVTVLQVRGADGVPRRWEPFSSRREDACPVRRDIEKSLSGNQLCFREAHPALGLEFSYTWMTSAKYGFVRRAGLRNVGDAAVTVKVLDGLRNLMPSGVSMPIQQQMSCLVDAYKKTDLDPQTGLGFVTLSAILTDKAEPSEALRANVVWQEGLPDPVILLSEKQLPTFHRGGEVQGESEVRGRRGAYLAVAELALPPGAAHAWSIVADVDLDRVAVADLQAFLRQPAGIRAALDEDVRRGTEALRRLVASADGLQGVAEPMTAAHHRANVQFNLMRGGIFADGYRIDRNDFAAFLGGRSREVRSRHAAFLAGLPDVVLREDLMTAVDASGDADLIRLCREYLPLCFSRRHGDPSRPWNRFSIALTDAAGRRSLAYQGNWRDIFQNWEALSLSFPDYLPGMIAVFLDAVTVDGYNPYRIARDGVEWEVPEPDNPWSSIGYWGDHQVVYLLKLLEWAERFQPGALAGLLGRKIFVHAEIPYEIRPFADLLRDPRNSIAFNQERHDRILRRTLAEGADGRLLHHADGGIVHANFAEKMLVVLLAKLTNFVPGGGIWMNTQRPEWNDANNALAGWGLSMVTLAYLRRFCAWLRTWANSFPEETVEIAVEVLELSRRVTEALRDADDPVAAAADPGVRFRLMAALGEAGSDYRKSLYQNGLSGASAPVPGAGLVDLCDLALAHLDAALRRSRRPDGLYHAYNLLVPRPDVADIRHLQEMLEGQVAVLSSGLLSPTEALDVCRALRNSALYRPDQHSYLLYPDRRYPTFLEKNNVPAERVAPFRLVAAMQERGDRRILARDRDGVWHFHAGFRNVDDLARQLDALAVDPACGPLAEAERAPLLALFEEVFSHHSFTGRSGSFFGYEGLGCIYWHMVAKLLLAIQENLLRAESEHAPRETVAALAAAYWDVRAGLGFNKSPAAYGAFPADPYSHTRGEGGARQPGMTGQVKEEVITRWGELGVRIADGCIAFSPLLLRDEEFAPEAGVFRYVDVGGRDAEVPLPAGSLAFTVCQVPVLCAHGGTSALCVHLADGSACSLPAMALDADLSRSVFRRDGRVRRIEVVHSRLGG